MPLNLPTLADMDADRKGKQIPKGQSRLQKTVADTKLVTVTEKDFRSDVWTRDKGCCRKCLRKVIKTLARVPERGEVHHIHGRGKELRHDSRAALLLCAACHEQVTGRVNERWMIRGTEWFTARDRQCIDARFTVKFIRL